MRHYCKLLFRSICQILERSDQLPAYNFDFSQNADAKVFSDQQFTPLNRKGDIERLPEISPSPLRNLEGMKRTRLFNQQNVDISEEIREMLPQGFRTMDRGIKNYFNGIRVPTKDGIKMMQTRISGGDKPYLIWAQDIKRGRVSLPVMSIKRENQEYFVEKFSTPHGLYFRKRFANCEGSSIVLTNRPVPCKVNYSLSVWAEHKRDLEYIQYQIVTRFNPIAEFLTEDEYLKMTLVLHYDGMTTAVDDEVPPDQRQNKRYDYNIHMEGYLPLPERIVPSILGRVTTLRDGNQQTFGEILQEIQGKGV